jgi:FMN-dependent NADH-azoreductase
MAEMDFADRYIRALLSFLGIEDVSSVICEGHEYAPELADTILQTALAEARRLAAEF